MTVMGIRGFPRNWCASRNTKSKASDLLTHPTGVRCLSCGNDGIKSLSVDRIMLSVYLFNIFN